MNIDDTYVPNLVEFMLRQIAAVLQARRRHAMYWLHCGDKWLIFCPVSLLKKKDQNIKLLIVMVLDIILLRSFLSV